MGAGVLLCVGALGRQLLIEFDAVDAFVHDRPCSVDESRCESRGTIVRIFIFVRQDCRNSD
jgi:hypothetical protein